MSRGFPGGSVVKNLPVNAGEVGSIPDSGRSTRQAQSSPCTATTESQVPRARSGSKRQGFRGPRQVFREVLSAGLTPGFSSIGVASLELWDPRDWFSDPKKC